MCKVHEGLIEVIQDLEERLEHAHAKIADADEANDALRREIQVLLMRIGKLKAENERDLGATAEAKIVLDLIEFWRAETGHEKATVSVSGKRADYVRKALRWKYTQDQIKDVFRVAGRFPYVDPRRSNHPSGRCSTGDVLRDDIPTLLKDEVTIDRLLSLVNVHELAAAPGAEGKEEVSFTTAERIRQANYPLARVLAALWEVDGELENPDADTWRVRCPVHFGDALIARRSADGLMSIECERGCEFWRLLAALKLEPADLFENADYDPDRRSAANPRPIQPHLQEAAGLLAARLSGLAGPATKV